MNEKLEILINGKKVDMMKFRPEQAKAVISMRNNAAELDKISVRLESFVADMVDNFRHKCYKDLDDCII